MEQCSSQYLRDMFSSAPTAALMSVNASSPRPSLDASTSSIPSTAPASSDTPLLTSAHLVSPRRLPSRRAAPTVIKAEVSQHPQQLYLALLPTLAPQQRTARPNEARTPQRSPQLLCNEPQREYLNKQRVGGNLDEPLRRLSARACAFERTAIQSWARSTGSWER